VDILLSNASSRVNNPKLAGIEIKRLAPHLAHAVANGPQVDITNAKSALVPVNCGLSHTHAPNKNLNTKDVTSGQQLGTGMVTNSTLPVGEHSVSLTVVDTAGNQVTETTTITMLPFGYPVVTTISPNTGGITGGETITISGSGFNYTASQTIVHFGLVNLTASQLTLVNQFTIRVKAPIATLGAPVQVSLRTPLAESNAQAYTYVNGDPIVFAEGQPAAFSSPNAVKIGPDRRFYVASYGPVTQLTQNADFYASGRNREFHDYRISIHLGMKFDPMETNVTHPTVYVTSKYFFHGESNSTSGESINSKCIPCRAPIWT
jgi:IPT/TIG domain